MLDSIRGRR